MASTDDDELNQLLGKLAAGSDDCWDVYEEVGRIVVAQLNARDWRALRSIADAWMTSAAAQGRLADTPPEAPDHAAAETQANHADALLGATIVRAVFGDEPPMH
ncbi:hypothetical protein [Paraburkholderia caballeronis]|uniref:hypothetical protein n=1 Tax=Paraburkholderia caballeronis TaxID=416943 RepID=UPI001065538A|nr:hypothetical protein [Paraburkholderia caballeronis]TDV16690.1 hypothetical protein C7408_105310 [Paraburkholderia caballeronis]TDV19086.1 hypothetical protein C7406_104356 [Paraburkholderia caballeronis]TDV27219.1 hypothetical protein C7404_105310 [Paraburkholderia caballeronis]